MSHIKAGGVCVATHSLIITPTSGTGPGVTQVSTFPVFVLPMSFSQFNVKMKMSPSVGADFRANYVTSPNTIIRQGANFWRIG